MTGYTALYTQYPRKAFLLTFIPVRTGKVTHFPAPSLGRNDPLLGKTTLHHGLYSQVRAGKIAQVVKCLLNKYETLSSNPSTTKKKNKNKTHTRTCAHTHVEDGFHRVRKMSILFAAIFSVTKGQENHFYYLIC
jgi:hypothetical protein